MASIDKGVKCSWGWRPLLAVLVAMAFLSLTCYESLPPPEERQLAVYPTDIKDAPEIRVLAADDIEKGTLSVTGPFRLRVRAVDGRDLPLGGGKDAITVQILPTSRGVKLGMDEYEQAAILPDAGTWIILRCTVGEREQTHEFRDALHLSRRLVNRDGKVVARVRAVARLNIEEYLVGVLAGEMPASWPMEALRAQAVASRTFALYHIKTRSSKEYDVVATTRSQVWKPQRQPNPRLVTAVNSTRGAVLLDRNRIFPAYFHSQCGGYTADAHQVFLVKDIASLWGVRCPYCLESGERMSMWRFSIAKDDLTARLHQRGLIRSGSVQAVRPRGEGGKLLTTMGRVYALDVVLAGGTVMKNVPANDFRLAVGGERGEMESTFFSVAHTPAQIIFEGQGFGHGVGMCQHGARYLAEKENRNFREILLRYYVGAQLARLW